MSVSDSLAIRRLAHWSIRLRRLRARSHRSNALDASIINHTDECTRIVTLTNHAQCDPARSCSSLTRSTHVRHLPVSGASPVPDAAARVAAVPYDVVSSDEARALAEGNPLSFLHVSRPEIDLPPGADPHADAAYAKAADNFAALRQAAPLVVEDAPRFYVYRLHDGRAYADRRRRVLLGRRIRRRPDSQAREDAARQGGRSHPAHAGHRGADRARVPHLQGVGCD